MSLRTLMVIPSYYPKVGGAEKQLGHLANKLLKIGGNVEVVTRLLPGTREVDVVSGVSVRRLRGNTTLSYLVGLVHYLIKYHRSIDVVHVHTLNSPAVVSAILGKLLSIPVVLKVTRSGKNTQLSRYQSSFIGRSIFALMSYCSSAVIAITADVEKELLDAGVNRDKIKVIPNGVVMPKAALSSSENEAIELVYVGRLIKRKRVHFLIDAISKLESTRKVNVKIIGTGEELDALKTLAETAKCGHLIEFLGEKKQAEVFEYLQKADIFVLPSDSEGMSNALLEGMANNNAVIATSISANKELVEHGANGLLFSSQEELLECIRSLVEGCVFRQELADKARATIEERFSIGMVAGQYHSLYSNICKKSEK